MAGFFSKLKEKLSSDDSSGILEETEEEGYLELGTESPADSKSKIVVRPFIIENFENIKPILDALRAGDTIALVNIKPLKDKDLIELKRAINKLKKTCDAIDGDIAGFGEDWVAAVPSFAHIQRSGKSVKETPVSDIKEIEE
ncbi:cell division protein SepF [Candidatus Woesearchaeota archaeon]|nr:cell division protein SepF [Candidatus Woesearchaeota archaeon]